MPNFPGYNFLPNQITKTNFVQLKMKFVSSCSTYFLHMEQWWHLSGLMAWQTSQNLAAAKEFQLIILKKLNNIEVTRHKKIQ